MQLCFYDSSCGVLAKRLRSEQHLNSDVRSRHLPNPVWRVRARGSMPARRKRRRTERPTVALTDWHSSLLSRALCLSPGLGCTLSMLRDFATPSDFMWLVVILALQTCTAATFSSICMLSTFAGEHRVTKAFRAHGPLAFKGTIVNIFPSNDGS